MPLVRRRNFGKDASTALSMTNPICRFCHICRIYHFSPPTKISQENPYANLIPNIYFRVASHYNNSE